MTRGIFIIGNESALFTAACAEAAKRVEQFAASLIPNPLPGPESPANREELDRKRILLPWNPSSPIAARTLVLAAENRLGRIDDALFVCSPPAVYRPPEALLPGETDKHINDQIKGWFFLVRELALVFKARGSGTLALAVPEILPGGGKDSPADLLGAPSAAAFRALAQGILASSASEPFSVMGFTGSEAGAEKDFAAWFFKLIDESSRKNVGRWHKYSKLGFFR